MSGIQQFILLIPIILLSLSVHEYSHGRVSYMLGDPTPKLMGRLTLNPLAHLSLLGTLALVLTRMFGWAKPVPINPRYYNNPRKGMMLVGIAGPASNFVLAIIFSLLIRFVMIQTGIEYINGRIMGPTSISSMSVTIFFFLYYGIMINISLGIFNLIPVPPLDGSKVLRGFLPARFDRYFLKLEGPVGMFVLLILIYTGIISGILRPAVINLINLLI